MRKTKTATDSQCFYKGSLTPLIWVKLKYTYAVGITKITAPQKFMVFQDIQVLSKVFHECCYSWIRKEGKVITK